MNKVILGDCLEVMKDIPDGSIDMVVTSPPYDKLRTYNGSLDWGEHIWKPCIQELFRIIKDGGVVVWIVGDATIKGSEKEQTYYDIINERIKNHTNQVELFKEVK